MGRKGILGRLPVVYDPARRGFAVENSAEFVKTQIRQKLDDLAHEAAEDSMLGSGIGMSGQRIAMQMRRLPKGHNVFELNAPRFWQCRNLGANSARAVKKMPFKAIYRGE